MKLLILLDNGFEEVEALTVADFIRRAEIEVELISCSGREVVLSSHGVKILTDGYLENVENYDAVYLPGGVPGADNLRDNESVKYLLEDAKKENKLIAAICRAPIALESAGILPQKYTCYPGVEKELENKNSTGNILEIEENIITALGPAASPILAFKIIEMLKGKEVSEKVKEDLLFEKVFGK